MGKSALNKKPPKTPPIPSYTYKTLPDNTVLHSGEQIHFKIDGEIGYFTYDYFNEALEGPFDLPPSYANEPISGKVLDGAWLNKIKRIREVTVILKRRWHLN
jgi:hypothetical protein